MAVPARSEQTRPDEPASPRQLRESLDGLIEFLDQTPKPLGLLTGDTEHAWQALTAIRTAGLRLPEDVALVSGGEDQELFEAIRPTMTAIAQDTHQLGYQAAAMLDRAMQGQSVPRQVYVPPIGLNVRQSSDHYAYQDEHVVRALRIIWSRVGDRLSLEDVLDEMEISKATLIRKFKAVLGRTPGQVIKESRIETAKRLLRTTDTPLVQVALESGLGSQSYMSRVILEETGLTPLQYRHERIG